MTVIVIVAVLIVFAFALVYFLRDSYLRDVTKLGGVSDQLTLAMDSIKKEAVYPCIEKKTKEALKIVGDNGGYLNSDDKMYYYAQGFTLLCKPVQGEPDKCAREVLNIDLLQSRLSEYLSRGIFNCIDLSPYMNKDYTLQRADELKADVEIGAKNIIVDVNYPITVQKGVASLNVTNFKSAVDVRLADILIAVNDVLNAEASEGYFDAGDYSISHPRNDVRKFKLGNKRFYVVKDSETGYQFRFGVESEGTND